MNASAAPPPQPEARARPEAEVAHAETHAEAAVAAAKARADAGVKAEAAIAVRNGMTLGTSLLLTWSVAFGLRLLLPRHFGPALFGVYNFADNITALAFIFLYLGIEVYVQREIPLRPDHASDFFAGVTLFRLVAAVPVFGILAAYLVISHRDAVALKTVFFCGIAQLFIATNLMISAVLHASRRVNGVAVLNVVAKVIWGLGIGVTLVTKPSVELIAVAFAFSEAFRCVWLWRIAKRDVGLRWRVDRAQTIAAVRSSMPYYVNSIALGVYGSLGATILSAFAGDTEIGYYGVASNIAWLSLLISPVVGWVLTPMLARTRALGEDQFYQVLRRSLELIITLVTPVSLILALGAPEIVHAAFGPTFTPAIGALRVLAPMLLLTYLAMLIVVTLNMLSRGWEVARVTFVSVIVSIVCNATIDPWLLHRIGTGGGGIGAAISTVISEAFVAVALTYTLGRRAFDPRSVAAISKSVGVALVVVALDRGIARIGAWRLAVDAVAYLGLAVLVGALRTREIANIVQLALQSRRERTS